MTPAAAPTTSRCRRHRHRARRRRQRGRQRGHRRRGHRADPGARQGRLHRASRRVDTLPDDLGLTGESTAEEAVTADPFITVDANVNFFTGESQSARPERHRAGLPAPRRRRPARADHRHVLGRPVADLRHDRPHQLRPRRDGDVRRAWSPSCSTSLGRVHIDSSAAADRRRSGGSGWSSLRSRSCSTACSGGFTPSDLRATAPERRSDLADGDHGRPVDHAQEHLPVPVRRARQAVPRLHQPGGQRRSVRSRSPRAT